MKPILFALLSLILSSNAAVALDQNEERWSDAYDKAEKFLACVYEELNISELEIQGEPLSETALETHLHEQVEIRCNGHLDKLIAIVEKSAMQDETAEVFLNSILMSSDFFIENYASLLWDSFTS